MFAILLRVAQAAARYGQRVVDWVWANSSRIYQWIRDGLAVDAIINRVLEILGLN